MKMKKRWNCLIMVALDMREDGKKVSIVEKVNSITRMVRLNMLENDIITSAVSVGPITRMVKLFTKENGREVTSL